MKSATLALGLLAALATASLVPKGKPVHDPSSLIDCNRQTWFFTTGCGLPSYSSIDMASWKPGPPVFQSWPAWAREFQPNHTGHFWAPDVLKIDRRFLLYYSVSQFGKQTSAIGLATNSSLDPSDPSFGWKDAGIVVRSSPKEDFNAIDPSVFLDTDRRLWMAFGSFWGGIKLVELSPVTGLRKEGAKIFPLAWAKEIEAACLAKHEGQYYLFVNWGLCCRGLKSTYEIRVGRSARITGPYRDKNGVEMSAGGGSLFLGSEGRFVGPGHAGILRRGSEEWVSFHFYDGDNHGIPALGLRRLKWGADGWPVAGGWISAGKAP